MLQFDMLSPYFGSEYQSAGVAGLLIALESLTSNPHCFRWEHNNRCLEVSWNGSPIEAWDWLLHQTYQIQNGLITLPTSGTHPVFVHNGFLATVLQVPATRALSEPSTYPVPCASNSDAVIHYSTRQLSAFIHQSFSKKISDSKGSTFTRKPIYARSWLIPGCTGFADGSTVKMTPEAALAAIFSPLVWGFYEVREQRAEHYQRYATALVCPNITTLKPLPILKPQTPEDYTRASLADACMHFASLNQCPVYGKLFHSAKANRAASIVEVTNLYLEDLTGYQTLTNNLPNHVRCNDADVWFVNPNQVRGAACKNIAAGKSWYEGLGNLPFFKEVQYNRFGVKKLMGSA